MSIPHQLMFKHTASHTPPRDLYDDLVFKFLRKLIIQYPRLCQHFSMSEKSLTGRSNKWSYLKLWQHHRINGSFSSYQKQLTVACYPPSCFWPVGCRSHSCGLPTSRGWTTWKWFSCDWPVKCVGCTPHVGGVESTLAASYMYWCT